MSIGFFQFLIRLLLFQEVKSKRTLLPGTYANLPVGDDIICLLRLCYYLFFLQPEPSVRSSLPREASPTMNSDDVRKLS